MRSKLKTKFVDLGRMDEPAIDKKTQPKEEIRTGACRDRIEADNCYVGGKNGNPSAGSLQSRTDTRIKSHVISDKARDFRISDMRPVRQFVFDYYVYVIVGLSAVGCYWNSLQGEFVHDDVMAIVRNLDVRSESPMSNLWLHDFWGRPINCSRSHKSYRPLTVLTFRLNYYLDGLNPFGYHVTNVFLHVVSAMLFVYICDKLLQFGRVSVVLAGVLFAVHPIHTEAVSGVVGRADLLCAIFLQSSVIFHVWNDQLCMIDRRSEADGQTKPPAGRWSAARVLSGWRYSATSWISGWWWWSMVSLVSSTGAVLSKETGFASFAVCLSCDLYYVLTSRRFCATPTSGDADDFRSRSMRHEIVTKGSVARCLLRPGLTLSTMFVVLCLRCAVMNWSFPTFTEEDNPASFHELIYVRFLTYMHIASLNLWLTVNPSILSYDWTVNSVPLITTIADSRNLASFILLSVIMTAVLSASLLRKQLQENERRRLYFGLSIIIFSVLPTTNLMYRVGFVIAERLLYVPSLGWIILVVQSFNSVYHRLLRMRTMRFLFCACAIILVTSNAARTVVRNKVWRSREALFTSGIQSKLGNAKLHYNYANLMKDHERTDEAVHHYQEAIKLWPTFASAKNNLATLIADDGTAEELYKETIHLQPCHANAHFNLGNLMSRKRQPDQAIIALWNAIRCDPDSFLPHSSLAQIFQRLRHVQLADWHYRKALELAPDRPHLYHNYAIFLQKQGFETVALYYFRRAYELNKQDSMTNTDGNLDSKPHDALGWGTETCPQTIDAPLPGPSIPGGDCPVCGSLPDAASPPGDSLPCGPLTGAFQTDSPAEQMMMAAIKQRSDVYGHKKLHDRAVQLLLECMANGIFQNEDNTGTLHFEMAKHLQDLGKLTEAFEHYHLAVKHNPTLSEASHRLAVFYHLQGRLREARRFYEKAYKTDPSSKLLLDNMAKLNAAMSIAKNQPTIAVERRKTPKTVTSSSSQNCQNRPPDGRLAVEHNSPDSRRTYTVEHNSPDSRRTLAVEETIRMNKSDVLRTNLTISNEQNYRELHRMSWINGQERSVG